MRFRLLSLFLLTSLPLFGSGDDLVQRRTLVENKGPSLNREVPSEEDTDDEEETDSERNNKAIKAVLGIGAATAVVTGGYLFYRCSATQAQINVVVNYGVTMGWAKVNSISKIDGFLNSKPNIRNLWLTLHQRGSDMDQLMDAFLKPIEEGDERLKGLETIKLQNFCRKDAKDSLVDMPRIISNFGKIKNLERLEFIDCAISQESADELIQAIIQQNIPFTVAIQEADKDLVGTSKFKDHFKERPGLYYPAWWQLALKKDEDRS